MSITLIKKYPETPGYKENTTSKDVAMSIKENANSIRRKVLFVLKNKDSYGATTDEVASLLNISILSVRPRFSELRKSGFIEDSKERRINESKHKAIVWRYVKDE
tara:strand:- start:213 stop:527 length:315 start_codon:yes stop_codon:yes gene_type:complete